MAAGRPTEYQDNYVQKAEEYIASCGREQMTLPTREGLADALDCDDETLIEWSKSHPKFSATLKKLDGKQKRQLIDDGMYGGKEVNSTMAIFLLKVNHGMIETEKKMLVGGDGQELRIKIINDDGDRFTNQELPKAAGDL